MIDIILDKHGNFEINGIDDPQQANIKLVNETLSIETNDLGVRAVVNARIVNGPEGERYLSKNTDHFAESRQDVITFFERCDGVGYPEYMSTIHLPQDLADEVRRDAAKTAANRIPESEDSWKRKREIFVDLKSAALLFPGKNLKNIDTSLDESGILSIRRFIPER